jgi:transposase InsO family protein
LCVRKTYPTWGSKKILAKFERSHPGAAWPARSTIDEILKRTGLVSPLERCTRRHPSAPPHVDAQLPNDVWSMDYKGWYRVSDRTRCDPLTTNDAYSRASLVCRALVSPKTSDVKQRLEEAFWQFGVPRAILSDNCTPFATGGIGGLSRLSVWLLRLGVRSLRIDGGKPEQNGKHERFHETLKAETAMPPRATIGAQQAAFSHFHTIYNEARPHEALGMKVPAELYELSPRRMPDKLPDYSYASNMELRRVRTHGSIQ